MNIEISGLTKSFDGVPVLKDINLKDELHSLAVIGPSGGGKSTLLRILSGLIPATSGTAVINGRRIGVEADDRRNYRKTIGFVFQHSGLFTHLSAKDNITLPLTKVHGFSEADADRRAEELLTRFGLIDDAGKRPSALSGGQRQRTAIARAIAPNPQLLFLDEPTSALDPEYTSDVLNLVHELTDAGMDMIIVTHEMGFARHACEKTAFLFDGTLLEYGTGQEIFDAPKTPELKHFLGTLLKWSV